MSSLGGAVDDIGYIKRLRAFIQNTCQEFVKAMRVKGHAKQIVDSSKSDSWTLPTTCYPSKISRSDYIGELMTLMKRSRGCELPGTYNPLIIGNLF